LIDQARLRAGRYGYQFQEPIPIEQLVENVCNTKQAYTQYGSLRPFGVAFLFAGFDSEHGFQLYQSDPSGNYSGWKATVIGANNQAGKSLLKTDYDDANLPTVEEALTLSVKVLNKTMDSTATSPEKMELFAMIRDEYDHKSCQHIILTAEETKKIIEAVEAEAAAAGDS